MANLLLALISAAALARLGELRAAPWSAIAVMGIWGVGVGLLPRPRGGPLAVLAAALAVRALLLPSPPSLSDDLYRYLWEGRLVGLGGNPYLTAPADPSLGADSIRALVNHPEISSIYPPLSLWIFHLLGRISYGPLVVKVGMGLLDAGIAWTLARILQARGRGLDGAWLYALLPLAAVESAGSGHMEALALLPAMLAWERGGSGLGWAGLGALMKLLPAVLIGALWRRRPALLIGVLLVGILATWPLREAGPTLLRGLGAYARDWRFNESLFLLYSGLLGPWARPAAVGTGALVVAWALRTRSDPAAVLLWAGGAFVLLSPTVHPWYLLWAWAPALICGVRAWTLLAVLIPLSYAALASYDPTTGAWMEPWWPRWIIYPPFGLALLWEWRSHAIRPGPWAPGPPTSPSPSVSPI